MAGVKTQISRELFEQTCRQSTSKRQVFEALRICKETFNWYVTAYGINIKQILAKRDNAWTEEQENELQRLKNKGLKDKEIAEIFGRSPGSVAQKWTHINMIAHDVTKKRPTQEQVDRVLAKAYNKVSQIEGWAELTLSKKCWQFSEPVERTEMWRHVKWDDIRRYISEREAVV